MRRRIFGIICLSVLSGCASVDVNSLYPQYASRKDSIERIIAFSNVQIIEDGLEFGIFLNVNHNIAIASALQDKTKKILTKKGYDLLSLHNFVGLIEIETSDELIVRADKWRSNKYLPYYADEDFRNSPSQMETINSIFHELYTTNMKSNAEQPTQYLTSALALNGIYDADVYLFYLASGKHIGFTKQVTQGVATGLATLGMASIYQIGGHQGWVCLVDAKSGEILWMNGGYQQSGFGSKSTHLSILGDVLSQLPSR